MLSSSPEVSDQFSEAITALTVSPPESFANSDPGLSASFTAADIGLDGGTLGDD